VRGQRATFRSRPLLTFGTIIYALTYMVSEEEPQHGQR